jgi:FixJ family two-component response regulator
MPIDLYSAKTPDGTRARPAVTQAEAVVFVVDDDVSIRESLEPLMTLAGWRPQTFESARAFLEFLDRPRASLPGCVVLDVSLPDLNGLELQRRLGAGQRHLPIVFITGYGDVPMTVRAMKAGAVEFLTKPFSDDALCAAVEQAIEHSRAALDQDAELQSLRAHHASLSRREREVMTRVVAGRLNKQIAAELGISEITVKAHRGQVMRKMHADSVADLVRISARLGLPHAP